MTEGGPPRQQRRLKTWSSLGQLGRIPSEYEIVTHNLNYTTRPNRTSALESNPTTPANMWLVFARRLVTNTMIPCATMNSTNQANEMK